MERYVMLERLRDTVNANERLVHKGRFVSAVVLIGIGDDEYRLTIDRGRLEAVERGPFVMPSYTFGLRAAAKDWERFWLPVPPPGFHDLLALLKARKLRLEGDLHTFMANLFYFKEVMASVRTGGA